jgi:hypothetical protein
LGKEVFGIGLKILRIEEWDRVPVTAITPSIQLLHDSRGGLTVVGIEVHHGPLGLQNGRRSPENLWLGTLHINLDELRCGETQRFRRVLFDGIPLLLLDPERVRAEGKFRHEGRQPALSSFRCKIGLQILVKETLGFEGDDPTRGAHAAAEEQRVTPDVSTDVPRDAVGLEEEIPEVQLHLTVLPVLVETESDGRVQRGVGHPTMTAKTHS